MKTPLHASLIRPDLMRTVALAALLPLAICLMLAPVWVVRSFPPSQSVILTNGSGFNHQLPGTRIFSAVTNLRIEHQMDSYADDPNQQHTLFQVAGLLVTAGAGGLNIASSIGGESANTGGSLKCTACRLRIQRNIPLLQWQ